MDAIKPYTKDGLLNAIIETPKNSHCKNSYDPALRLFRLKKCLPVGMHFPYDFGFIPGTLGEDGDPLDVLILSSYPTFVGCLVTIQLIGVLEAEQTEKNNKETVRNDRLIGCLACENEEPNFSTAKALPQHLAKEIEAFFVQYNRLDGKRFTPLGWYGPKRAEALIEEGIKYHKKYT
jgi:inorganic pyrophosphatase